MQITLKYFIILLVVFNCNYSYGQFWMYDAGGTNVDEANSVTTDNNGNVYTTGYFGVSASFSQSINFVSSGASDIFVTKQNNIGILLWAIKAGGWGEDRGLAIKSDASGNVYVTGFFYGTATFDTQTITSNGAQDIFLAKYDSNGNLIWVSQAGGINADIANSLTVDNNGEITITGQFSGTATFETTNITSLINPSTGNYAINTFTAHYNNNGNLLWVKSAQCDHDSRGISISSDQNGNTFVVGQFSDTITFDNVHNNNLNNAIFLVKYNSSGNEVWFRKIGGSLNNIAYSVTCDLNNNVIITGEASGLLNFFGLPNYTLSNLYSYQAFVAKYDNSGNLIWAVSDGSTSEVSSRSVCTDNTGNIYIAGLFKCKFSEYADVFGQGTFNSVGYNDIFETKFDPNGQRLWMRNFGSNKEDFVSGICIYNNVPIVSGSFKNCLNVPSQGNFTDYQGLPIDETTSDNNGLTYCGDSHYGEFSYINSNGNSDIFVANAIDLNRQPYDYYERTGSGCNRPFVGSCIQSNSLSCNDFDTACFSIDLYAITHASSTFYNGCSVGPKYNLTWSNGYHYNPISVSSTGTYFVTVTSEDGCFSSNDSINVVIYPGPSVPLLSDNLGIGTLSPTPYTINLCNDTTIILSATNITTQNYYWTTPQVIYDSVITINQGGTYLFTEIDEHGCEVTNYVTVIVGSNLNPIQPFFFPFATDSVTICRYDYVKEFVYDSISDPNHLMSCNPNLLGITNISIIPNVNNSPFCSGVQFYTDTSGLFVIDYELIRYNACGDTDTTYAHTQVYVTVLDAPQPINLTITGGPSYCIGDTVLLVACCGPNYHWTFTNPIIGDANNDSIYITQPGSYNVYSADTSITGCVAIDYANVYMGYWSSPQIQMNPPNGLICPNDTVTLILPATGINYEWYGPYGIISSTNNEIYVTSPGYYFCIVTFPGDCRISSNTVEVRQYTTPFLLATPDDILCPNEVVQINLITNPGSYYFWLSPLSGNTLTQMVNTAGTYMCNVYSCNIQTLASVTITASYPVADIYITGNSVLCPGDTAQLHANQGMEIYHWFPYNQSDTVITVDTTEIYYVITTDVNGCTAISDSIDILSVIIPDITIQNDTVCNGQTAVLSASGANNYFWNYYQNSPTYFYTGNTLTTNSLTNDTTFWVYTTQNNCSSSPIPVFVIVLDSLNTLNTQLTSNSPLCEGNNLTMSTNSPPNYIYHWSGPNGFLSSQSELNFIANPSQSGIYSLFVEYNGCISYSTSIDVTVYPTPPLTVSPPENICLGDTVSLLAGGGYVIHWTPEYMISSPYSYSTLAFPDVTTNYTAIVTDTNSCSNSASINIYVQQPITLNYQNYYQIIIGESVPINIQTSENAINWQWTPETWLNCTDCQNPISTPMDNIEYNVILTDSLQCFDISGTVTIDVLKEYSVDVPSAFTPNGDGNNDVVYVKGWGIKKLLEFRIFNRWGEELFYSNDINYGWDGYFRNKIQNIETYVFVVKVLFYNDEEKSINGYINLIR